MGVFRVRVKVFSLKQPERSREIDVTVDSGATYPVVPQTLARDLGIAAQSRRTFTLADGRQIDRGMAEAGIAHDGRSTACMVVLGEGDDVALLGAHALEGLGLEVDSVGKTLRPATQYLL
jgi:clan AA aspartic protease